MLTAAGVEHLHEARATHLAGVRERFLEQLDDAELDALGGYWSRIQAELRRS